MSETEDLIEQFQNLNIEQKQLIKDLIQELTITNNNNNTTNQQNTNSNHRNRRNRIPNSNFISSDRTTLAIGDRVQVLSTRKTGSYGGDIATVVKFNKKYVAIQLVKNDSRTQRDSKYLLFLP